MWLIGTKLEPGMTSIPPISARLASISALPSQPDTYGLEVRYTFGRERPAAALRTRPLARPSGCRAFRLESPVRSRG